MSIQNLTLKKSCQIEKFQIRGRNKFLKLGYIQIAVSFDIVNIHENKKKSFFSCLLFLSFQYYIYVCAFFAFYIYYMLLLFHNISYFLLLIQESHVDVQLDNRHLMLRGETVSLFFDFLEIHSRIFPFPQFSIILIIFSFCFLCCIKIIILIIFKNQMFSNNCILWNSYCYSVHLF